MDSCFTALFHVHFVHITSIISRETSTKFFYLFILLMSIFKTWNRWYVWIVYNKKCVKISILYRVINDNMHHLGCESHALGNHFLILKRAPTSQCLSQNRSPSTWKCSNSPPDSCNYHSFVSRVTIHLKVILGIINFIFGTNHKK